MEKRRLGRTDLDVSLICLGTMTWGEQNTEAEGHEQLDYALSNGVNFIDTAEMYAIPPRKETYGATETIIGNWFEKTGRRNDVILATKVIGAAERFPYVRPELNDGRVDLNRPNILAACDASLKRLKTDHIDLYQIHWPSRATNFFGQLGYTHQEGKDGVSIEETMSAMDELVKAGKVRHVGLSNETPWGMLEHIRVAEQKDLPRPQSIQNPYNLLKRDFEVGCAEVSIRENVGLLAYSPLAMGALSGKYLDGQRPEGARISLWPEYFPRYIRPGVEAEIAKYMEVANEAGLDPVTLALSFVNQQPFVTSNIIGATTMDQLKVAIGSANTMLSDETLSSIHKLHLDVPYPVTH
ncbi:aldo/keto reductase [Curvivirga aplysinae]|uniref:aldo/keto reductase n=1 Tax=Curvivirga aplysinae TaxID=2529852 RepID=UPI0012BC042D|nr:aldo/keto reductase [Curvivirga aplysinae]MTI09465.1 aldo/keto reductase [Curvivirga aplysinae]